MDFTKEFIQENGLTPEQVTAVSDVVESHIETQKGSIWTEEWSGKANENAEGIIKGAGEKTVNLTGIARNDGEKWADYLSRSSDLYFEGKKTSLDRKISEYDAKIAAGGGDEALKLELKTAKEALDLLKKQEAKFADYEENDYKGKYEQASKDMAAKDKRLAFNSVKPTFPDTVNPFEAKAKWASFISSSEEKYNIVPDNEGTYWAVDKENEHKRFKLSDLVTKDETLTALTQGRQQRGPGGGPKTNVKIEGIPFDVPEGATSGERQTAIREYLAGQNISKTSPEYATKFSEYNKLILEKNPSKK